MRRGIGELRGWLCFSYSPGQTMRHLSPARPLGVRLGVSSSGVV